MKTEQEHTDEAVHGNNYHADGPTKMTRREALEKVGKHAVYTVPAVLAVLAATKSKSAHATLCGQPPLPACTSQ